MDYEGKRVRLRPIPENGVGIEVATVIHDYGDGMIMVEVDREFRIDKADDGLRECHVNQIGEVL